jgi:hypothetical protein
MSNLLSRNRLRLDHSPVETLRQTSTSIVPLLAQYHLMPQFLAESVIDRAIASIHCTVTEASEACQQLYQQFGLLTEEQQQTWRSHYGFTPYQVEQIATRSQRIDRFKQTMWEPGLESYFLTHKDRLDRVVYSLLRTQQPDMLHELFFRIQDGEHSFGELARQYSEGPEAATGGLCGPVERSGWFSPSASMSGRCWCDWSNAFRRSWTRSCVSACFKNSLKPGFKRRLPNCQQPIKSGWAALRSNIPTAILPVPRLPSPSRLPAGSLAHKEI